MPRPVTPEKRVASNSTQWKLLTRDFFDAPPEKVAQSLLGKLLLHRIEGTVLVGRIVETEAYLGEQDPAAHSARGRTARNAVLFGPPGHAYVYNIYGLHQCMNVSCLAEGTAGCVLLRALEPIEGIEQMRSRRRLRPDAALHALTSGPGKLCQALGITRAADNGRDVTSATSPLGLYEDGFSCGEISVKPRIGIRKAADLPLRFFLTGHPCVSVR
ncbi:MAG: DNA-3-methyladenine glycosylase [Acidobacteriaceae bacterium]